MGWCLLSSPFCCCCCCCCCCFVVAVFVVVVVAVFVVVVVVVVVGCLIIVRGSLRKFLSAFRASDLRFLCLLPIAFPSISSVSLPRKPDRGKFNK